MILDALDLAASAACGVACIVGILVVCILAVIR